MEAFVQHYKTLKVFLNITMNASENDIPSKILTSLDGNLITQFF